VAEIRVVSSWETVLQVYDSPAESNGFGNRRGAMTLRLREPGKDEQSLVAPLAFVALANEWAQSRLTSRSRRFHMRQQPHRGVRL
jgi:hypothetical protein